MPAAGSAPPTSTGFIARAKGLAKKMAKPGGLADRASFPPPAQAEMAQDFDSFVEEVLHEAPSTTRPLDRLVSLQKADGSWELSDILARLLGKPLAEIEKALSGETADKSRMSFATALALVWLEKHASAERDEWQMLAKKSESWLKRQAAPSSGTWQERAKKLLG
jgi:hypothetical protein